MEILQPYSIDTLQLISDDNNYVFYPGLIERGVIKLSVFSTENSFLDAEDLQENVDFYVKDLNLFIKPNEYLDRNGFSEATYNLQYDFLIRLDTSKFHLSEISPSRKEIRLEKLFEVGQDDNGSITEDERQAILDFMNEDIGVGATDTYQFNSILEISRGRSIPINGYAFDEVTKNKTTLVLKLNETLPASVSLLSTDSETA